MHSLRKNKGVSEAMVETNRNIARDLDVLTLVLADGYFVGVIEQDVGCLQSWICEEAGRDEITFALR